MAPMGNSLPGMQPIGVPGAPMFPPPAAGPGQMMFPGTQRNQPKHASQARLYNILPMISFKVRFYAMTSDGVTLRNDCFSPYMFG